MYNNYKETNMKVCNEYHHKYEENKDGRDFVVGDLHGCHDDLINAMKAVNFDLDKDRMFSVGDLVDRGPQSLECAQLVYDDWFYPVKGNHEEMLYETILRNSNEHGAMWFTNGGIWAADLRKDIVLKDVAQKLELLPIVISVGEGAKRFNIVHAELTHYENWNRVQLTDMMIDNWVFTAQDRENMLWGRGIINNGKRDIADTQPDQLYHNMSLMSLTFVGHTPVDEVVQCQQQMYIDTGAVYYHTSKLRVKPDNRCLTLACPTTKIVYSYNLLWKTVTETSFDDIAKQG